MTKAIFVNILYCMFHMLHNFAKIRFKNEVQHEWDRGVQYNKYVEYACSAVTYNTQRSMTKDQ